MVTTKAIVLGQKDFSDYDKIISFYTLDFGKIDLLARGLKKGSSKLAGHLEPFNLVDLMIIRGRERDYVGSAISENSFLNIKNNYYSINVTGQAFSFLRDLTFPNQVDFNIFLTLKDFLFFLNNNLEERLINNYLSFFKLKLLSLLGYDFDFSICFLCKKEKASFFNFFDKEVLCSDCFRESNIERTKVMEMGQVTLNFKKDILTLNLLEWGRVNIGNKQKKELDDFIDVVRKII